MFILKFILSVTNILTRLVNFLSPILFSKSRCLVPPVGDELLLKSAKTLASLIRNREIKCKDVISAYIKRCQQVQPYLNAIVEDRFKAALRQANEYDSYLENSEISTEELEKTKPLFGVPITVKESISVKGMSNRAGNKKSKRTVAEEDADIVKAIKDAGGIILCVTNTPVLCAWLECSNPITGTTNNPYDQSRSPGGSSGGEAALLGSAASVIGVGSDITGSLRVPALYTGIYGYKPSPYHISNKGHEPSSTDPWWNDIFTLGPMTRYAEDLPLIMKVLNKTAMKKMTIDTEVDLSKLKYYFIDNKEFGIRAPMNSEMSQAVWKFNSHMESKYKIKINSPKMTHLKNAVFCTMAKLGTIKDMEYPHLERGQESWLVFLKELVKKILFLSDAPLYTFLITNLKLLFKNMSDDTQKEMLEAESKLRSELQELVEDDGIIICTSFLNTAPKHNETFGRLQGFALSGAFNLGGLPAINCPLGFNSENIPLGIQLVAGQGKDRYLFALAEEIEQHFGGWVQPTVDRKNV